MANLGAFARFLFGLPAKVLVILMAGDIVAYFVPGHHNIAYAAGLLIGIPLQHWIRPRGSWMKESLSLVPILLLVGVVHGFLYR